MDQLKLFDIPQTQRTSDDYWTPKWIFDALGLTFDLDVACPPEGPSHTPCKAFYTQADDGLAQPWNGLVFMNPPYSKPAPWVHKWINHGNGIALLPFGRGRWNKLIWESQALFVSLVEIPDGTLMKFDHPSGLTKSVPVSVCLWAIGDTAKQALHNANIGKVR